MKRRLLSLLTLAALALSLLALPAQAAGQTELTGGKWTNHKFSVRFDAPSDTTATLMAASYDNGKMTQVKTQSHVKGGDTVTFDGLNEAYLVRVFAIDPESSKPICEQEEVTNPDALKVFQGTVTLPTADPTVTRALSSALDAYVEAQLAMEQYDRHFRTVVPSGSSAGGQSLMDQAAMPDSCPFPARPEGKSYQSLKTATIPYTQSVKSAASAVFTLGAEAAAGKKEPTVYDRLDRVNAACAVLNAAAEAEAAQLQSEAEVMEAASLQAASQDEQLEWARAITAHYDAIKSNKKLAQLAKDLGCDARRAYAQLTMAQNILKGQYSKEEGDLYLKWEKRMIATKAACKVGLFVCATVATGGATAASPAGFVSLGEATGIVVGAVDATLEVSTAGAKLILGPDSKVVQNVDDKLKPVNDALLLYGLFTGGGGSAGEQLAFLGDLNTRKNELYDNIKLKYNVDLNRMEADFLTLNPMDPAATLELAKKLLPPGTDLGLEKPAGVMTIDEVLEEFTDDEKRKSDDETLREILKEVDPEAKLEEEVTEYDQEVDRYTEEEKPDDPDTDFERPPRLWQSFDDDGNLLSEGLNDGYGNSMWTKYYDRDTHQLSSEANWFDADGTEVKCWTRYYCEKGNEDAWGQVKEIYYFQRDEYGLFEKPWYGLPSFSYYKSGNLSAYVTADRQENYTDAGILEKVTIFCGNRTTTTYEYFTEQPYGCDKFDPTGHIKRIKTVEQLDPPLLARTHFQQEWEVWSHSGDRGVEYGLRLLDWIGTESDFEIFYVEPYAN